jgi:hypothetical protein
MSYTKYTVIVYNDGSRSWWLDFQLHREDGPAVEYPNGYKGWYLKGEKLTEEEFLKRTQPQPDPCE